MPERDGVLEAGLEHGRRPAVVLGGAQHDDGVGGALLVAAALPPDLEGRGTGRDGDRQAADQEEAHEVPGPVAGQAP